DDPMGIKGLSVADLGIQMGASFTTAPVLLPNIALAGKIDIGKFSGEAVVAFDTRNPSKSMIAASYNKIMLWDLINITTSKKLQQKIPKGIKKTLESFYTENVNMEIVPFPLEVLEKHYDAGFRMEGAISVAGLKGEAAFDLDYDEGVSASGKVDPIDLKILKFKGAGKNAKPGFALELRKSKTPKLGLNGSVYLLGLQAETEVKLLDNGFQFEVGGKIFDLFKGQIKAHGTDLSKAGDIGLNVKLENEFSGFLEREAIKIIERSTSKAIKNLSKAQKNITKAQTNINNLDTEIKLVRKIVEDDQAKDRKKINKAKSNVKAAQNKVNKIDKKIKAKRKEYKKLKKHQHIKKTAINTQIATLKASKATATAALNSAQFVLNGMMKLNVNPDADPRMVSLYASQKSAIIALEAAKLYLENLKKTLGFTGEVGTFIIDKGADALIRVKKASFAGNLGTLHGAKVDLKLEVEWMKKKHKLRVKYDFKDMKSSLSLLVDMLMKKKN
ncbi:MAG: hypothetical protein HKN68_09190, partial [Saprospiraceae bacterium]|nr:hypothetical protein [Saprospiraceae bacterium]